MVHDELEDFATPVKIQMFVDDFYDNEQYNEESESDWDEMYYNYDDDEYFY